VALVLVGGLVDEGAGADRGADLVGPLDAQVGGVAAAEVGGVEAGLVVAALGLVAVVLALLDEVPPQAAGRGVVLAEVARDLLHLGDVEGGVEQAGEEQLRVADVVVAPALVPQVGVEAEAVPQGIDGALIGAPAGDVDVVAGVGQRHGAGRRDGAGLGGGVDRGREGGGGGQQGDA